MKTRILMGLGLVLLVHVAARAQVQRIEQSEPRAADGHRSISSRGTDDKRNNILSADEWRRVDAAVDRALAWLATQQQSNGSFPTLDTGQPGVTSLCVLAYVAHGHNSTEGPNGRRLQQAIDFATSCQKENGLITLVGPDGPRIDRNAEHAIGTCAAYNHAISSLMLSEIYGMCEADRATRVRKVINRALWTTLEMQRWPEDRSHDIGGWRYVNDDGPKDSDLSVTGWQLMFVRSARNAGFDVPKERIDDAVGYVRRSFDRRYGAFNYTISRKDSPSRGVAGHGILALGHAGFHNSLEAQQTGQWLMRYGFKNYNDNLQLNGDRYHYSLFTCCHGMYQLGSPYWEQFFPPVVRALLAAQNPNGSWEPESDRRDKPYGNSYTTALVVLSLGTPNQILPIFQR